MFVLIPCICITTHEMKKVTKKKIMYKEPDFTNETYKKALYLSFVR